MDAALRNDLVSGVLGVLRKASRGKGRRPHGLTAYQILAKLKDDVQDRLETAYGRSVGRGARRHYSPASAVAAVIRNHLKQVRIRTMASARSRFVDRRGRAVAPGYSVTALYSL